MMKRHFFFTALLSLSVIILPCFFSACSSGSTPDSADDSFTLHIQVSPTDTTALLLYLQPEGAYDGEVPTMAFDGKTFTAQCPASAAHFYCVTCLKDGGQYIMPLWSPSGELTIALSLTNGAPTGFTPVARLTSKSESAALKAMSAYFGLTCDIQRTFWMNMNSTDESTLQDYINRLAHNAADGSKKKAVNNEVKDYLTAWAYLDGYNLIDSYNRSHAQSINASTLLQTTPAKALDNEIAMLHSSAALTAYSSIPKGDLTTRIQYVRQQFKTPAMQKALEKMILDNYLRHYDFNAGVDQGLEELTSAQQQLDIDSTYLVRFRQRMSSIIGAPFPEVSLEDRDGTVLDITTFRGKYLYIDLWASWCVPCVKEVPYLQSLEKTLTNDKVTFISISCDTDRDAWIKKMESLSMHGNQYIDVKGTFCDRLGVTGIPRFLIYDPDGRLLNADATRPSNPATLTMLEELK